MKIAYIPLDDRPVNIDRALWLAGSAGVEILLPEEELYIIRLDDMPQPNVTKQERIARLMAWLRDVWDECDAAVVSLDLLLSGGLAAARYLYDEDIVAECAALDELAALSKSKPMYVFDTVMRLASTGAFAGYGIYEYEQLRIYGSVARKQLDGAALTRDAVLDGYRYDEQGNEIVSPLSGEIITKYLKARERQFRLNDYLLQSDHAYQYLYIGVDDSMPQTTIQTNEIRYINSIAEGAILPATDEFGLMAIATFAALGSNAKKAEHDGASGGSPVAIANNLPTISVTYFGTTQDEYGDEYTYDSLRHSVDAHLEAMPFTMVDDDSGAVKLFVLTRPQSGQTDEEFDADCHALIDRLFDSDNVIVADCSYKKARLAELMLERGVPLCSLLAYSSWNTVSNALGIALSNGLAGYVGLRDGVRCERSFAEGMAFSFLKDCAYKVGAYPLICDYVQHNVGDYLNFYREMTDRGMTHDDVAERVLDIFLGENYRCSARDILANFRASGHDIGVKRVAFPMYRLFEMRMIFE